MVLLVPRNCWYEKRTPVASGGTPNFRDPSFLEILIFLRYKTLQSSTRCLKFLLARSYLRQRHVLHYVASTPGFFLLEPDFSLVIPTAVFAIDRDLIGYHLANNTSRCTGPISKPKVRLTLKKRIRRRVPDIMRYGTTTVSTRLLMTRPLRFGLATHVPFHTTSQL